MGATLGALAEPFAVALHAAGLARLRAGDAAIIWGAGSIGLLAVCAARLAGADPIIAVDTNPARLATAGLLGAGTTVEGRSADAVADVRRVVEQHPSVTVFDTVGRSETRQGAAKVAGPGGRVVLIGLHDPETTFEVNVLIRSEIALLCSYGYTQAELSRAVELLGEGAIPATSWIEERPLEAGPAAFAELVDAPGATTKIVLVPS